MNYPASFHKGVIKMFLERTLGVLVFSCPLILSLSFAHSAWEDWHLRQELAQVGVSTQATIQTCSYYKGVCNISYEFSVTARGQGEKYIGKDRLLSCGKCLPLGLAIPIRYVAQDPNRSGVEGRILFKFYMGMGIAALLINLAMLTGYYWKTIKSKIRGW